MTKTEKRIRIYELRHEISVYKDFIPFAEQRNSTRDVEHADDKLCAAQKELHRLTASRRRSSGR